MGPPRLCYSPARPGSEARSGFDDWQRTRHIPEIVSSGLLLGASYWIAAEANSGVAAPWVLPGLRMACYYAADAAQMETWFSSAGLGDAIEDGSSWFDNFHRLDGQLFTGNVYEFAGGRPSERPRRRRARRPMGERGGDAGGLALRSRRPSGTATRWPT